MSKQEEKVRFGQTVKALRLKNKLTQKELARAIGVSTRSLINYETGRCCPRQGSVMVKLADVLEVSVDYLLNAHTHRQGRAICPREADRVVREMVALFASGQMPEEDRDAAMRALQEAYWDGRKQAQGK